MCDSIVLASSVFGSIYICATSLTLIDKQLLENNINKSLLVINGCTFLISGSIFLYGINLSKCTF